MLLDSVELAVDADFVFEIVERFHFKPNVFTIELIRLLGVFETNVRRFRF